MIRPIDKGYGNGLGYGNDYGMATDTETDLVMAVFSDLGLVMARIMVKRMAMETV